MPIQFTPGQSPTQFLELGAAFLLSATIGLEREIRHKSAGLRTYTVVGTTAALFLLVSKYGFMNVLSKDLVVLDPSRVAAQIVAGIGFIGAGLIFVRGDAVKGLTTAATVWLVTAVGMACGAGLLLLALAVTILYFVIACVFPLLLHLLPGAPTPTEQNGRGDHD
jgi:putative Mg2+ transporter-C (MgtC) family protein